MFCVPDTTFIKVGNTDVLVSLYSPKTGYLKICGGTLEKVYWRPQKNYMGGKLPVTKYAFLYYFNSEQPTVQGTGRVGTFLFLLL